MREKHMVTVQLFAMLRELAGSGFVKMPLPEGGSVSSLIEEMIQAYPRLEDPFRNRKILVVINQRYASMSDTVSDGDEVGFLPPVTGG